MFKTELSCEEESLLLQLLDGKKLTRKELLLEINYCSQNTEAEEEGLKVAKSLFAKIKNTSDFEFDEYVSISQKNRYLPYHFVPHVSISRKLNEQQTNQAFKILNHYFEPFYGKVIQVALVKTNPYQEIKIWNL